MKTNKILHKIVTLGLAIAMLSSLFPTNVHAAEEDELIPIPGVENAYYINNGPTIPTTTILPTQTRGQLNIDGTQKKKLVQVLWDIAGDGECVVILDVPDEYQLYYEPDLRFTSTISGGLYGYMSSSFILSAYDSNGNLMNYLNPYNGLNYYDFSTPGICTYKEYGCYKKLWETKQYAVTNLGQNKYVRNDELGLFGWAEDGAFTFDLENLGAPYHYYYNEQGQFDHAVNTRFPDLQLHFYRNEYGQVVECADGALGDRGGCIIDYDSEGYIAHIYPYGASGVTGAMPKANYLTNSDKLTLIWE